MPWALDLPGPAEWSVQIVDIDTGAVLAARDEESLLSSASVGKLFVLIELAHRLADDSVDGAELLDRHAVEPVADSGLWQRLCVDRLPLLDVATLVGTVSDNWATNVLIDRLGLDAIRARAQQWAPHGSDLVDIVRGLRGPDDPPHLSRCCAADLVAVLIRLRCDAQVGTRVLDWLCGGVDHSMVTSAFDQDPLAHDEDPFGPTVVNKTGTNLGVRADVGLVTANERTLAYAVIANWHEDPPGRGRAEVLSAMRALGSQVLEEIR